jgi:WD40 repeat protein
MAVMTDLGTGTQTVYDGHDCDVTCVALHPSGELVATGQGMNAGGADASIHLWQIGSREQVAIIGKVLDERKNDGVTMRPFYPGALCALAFSPNVCWPVLDASNLLASILLCCTCSSPPMGPAVWGLLLMYEPGDRVTCLQGHLIIGVGKDEQHLVGVWDWRKGELMAQAPGLVARPLGVHQLSVAPQPLATDDKGRQSLFCVLVGVSNAPKFGKIVPVAAAGPLRYTLTFGLGQLGLKPGQAPPAALSAVAFGGNAFPAPSGAAHGLTFIGSSGGRIFVFDAPANELALWGVDAHQGPVTALCSTGNAIASGGADGFVYLWGPPAGARVVGGTPRAPVSAATAGGLEKAHTYSFTPATPAYKLDPQYRPTQLASSRNVSDPNHLVATQPKPKPAPVPGERLLELPTRTMNPGVGAIRSICVLPQGAQRAVSGGGLQVPTLCVGTARCSLWKLGPTQGVELSAAHFGHVSGVAAHPTLEGRWVSCGHDKQALFWTAGATLPTERLSLPTPAHCVAYSTDGILVAFGLDAGGLAVLRPRQGPLLGAGPPSGAGGAAGGAALGGAGSAAGSSGGAPALAVLPTGGTGVIEVIAFAPQTNVTSGGLIACGSHDRMVRILELKPEGGGAAKAGSAVRSASSSLGRFQLVPRCVCAGHTATVTHLDWSADGRALMSNCAAHEILIWGVPSGQRLNQPGRTLATAQWASWTCYLGFPCMGIWPDGSDSTDVNACHLARDGALLLTGGDDGLVKLFNAPCVVEEAPYVHGTGHSAPVTCTRFLKGDRLAVSAGGADRTVVLWQVVQPTGRADTARQRAGSSALPPTRGRQMMRQTPVFDIE